MSDLLPWFMPWSGRMLVLLCLLLGLVIASAGCRRRIGAPSERRSGGAWLIVCGLVFALSLPVYVAHKRMSVYGRDYYLRLEPLYSMFGQPIVRQEQRGPFTTTTRRDRRSGETASTVRPGEHPGDVEWAYPIYAWRVADFAENDGRDLNGNGRPNMVMVRHDGGNTFTFCIYELRDGEAQPILELTGSPGWIEGPDDHDTFSFRGDLQRQPTGQRWVVVPLVDGAELTEVSASADE